MPARDFTLPTPMVCVIFHPMHFETELKTHTENKMNQTNFSVFMISGFNMIWTFHAILNLGFYGIYQKSKS